MKGVTFLVLGLSVAYSCALHQRAYRPLDPYARYWAYAEACAGQSGTLRRVTWLEHDSARFMCGDVEARGCWQAPHYITLGQGQTADSALIVHEMIHDLLNGGKHNDEAFRKCGV